MSSSVRQYLASVSWISSRQQVLLSSSVMPIFYQTDTGVGRSPRPTPTDTCWLLGVAEKGLMGNTGAPEPFPPFFR